MTAPSSIGKAYRKDFLKHQIVTIPSINSYYREILMDASLPTSQALLTDFYRNWMIEVYQQENGFHGICRSPRAEQLSDHSVHACPSQAYQAIIKIIDTTFAIQSLQQVVRDLYELNRLDFSEWSALNTSLNQVADRYTTR